MISDPTLDLMDPLLALVAQCFSEVDANPTGSI